MLKIKNLYKSFDDAQILEDISLTFEPSKIYGLVGINGAGKSTMLRTLAGIYKPTEGSVTLDNEEVYENINAKNQIFYIPDEEVFLPCDTIEKNIAYLKTIYKNFDENIYSYLNNLFKLDKNKSLKSFSKGMKKQALLLITLSFTPKYIILDETFDGLDPLIRANVKKYLIELVEEKNLCILISTHSIADIENLADDLIILNNKNISVSNMLSEETRKYNKIQVCFKDKNFDTNTLELNIKHIKQLGSIYNITAMNTKNEIEQEINKYNTAIFDIFDVSKEEFFILEVEEDKNEY